MPGAEVVSELEPLRRLLKLILGQIILRDHVIVVVLGEVAPCRLAVDQIVRLDGRFLRPSSALDCDSAREAPLGRPVALLFLRPGFSNRTSG